MKKRRLRRRTVCIHVQLSGCLGFPADPLNQRFRGFVSVVVSWSRAMGLPHHVLPSVVGVIAMLALSVLQSQAHRRGGVIQIGTTEDPNFVRVQGYHHRDTTKKFLHPFILFILLRSVAVTC